MQIGQDIRVFQFVGHGHRVHEAGNGVMSQRDLAGGGISRHHLAAQPVDLVRRICQGLLICLRTRVTSRQSCQSKRYAYRDNPHHTI